MPSEAAVDRSALPQEDAMSLTKPMLGLAVGGVLGLMDGLSGFFEPSLAPLIGSVITFSLLIRIGCRNCNGICFAASAFDAAGNSGRNRDRGGAESAGGSSSGDGLVRGHHGSGHVAGRNCRIRDTAFRQEKRTGRGCALSIDFRVVCYLRV